MAKSKKTKDATSSRTVTKVSACICTDDYQDKKYGAGNRLFNRGVKRYTCTKCGQQRD